MPVGLKFQSNTEEENLSSLLKSLPCIRIQEVQPLKQREMSGTSETSLSCAQEVQDR